MEKKHDFTQERNELLIAAMVIIASVPRFPQQSTMLIAMSIMLATLAVIAARS